MVDAPGTASSNATVDPATQQSSLILCLKARHGAAAAEALGRVCRRERMARTWAAQPGTA